MIVVEHPEPARWRLRRGELEDFALRAHRAVRLRGEVNVLLTSNQRIKNLNRRFRRKNKATDVLSFPAAQGNGAHACGGDIAISLEFARLYAEKLGHSLTAELKILLLHGMIHLAGYDHEHDRGEMARLEARLRARFSLPLSLTERVGRP